MRWSILFLLVVFGGFCTAEDNALLQKPVTVNVVSKDAAAAIPEICAAAGIPVELQLIKQDPLVGPTAMSGGYSAARAHDNIQFKLVGVAEERLYSIQTAQPVALAKVLEDICICEGVRYTVKEGKVVITPICELPFQDQLSHTQSTWKFDPDPNWSALIQAGVKARTEPEDFTKRDWQSGPLELRRPLNGLKGHPARDAIRVWLLCEVAMQLTNTMNTTVMELAEPCDAIAAGKAAQQLYESADGAGGLAELCASVRAVNPAAPADDKQLLAQQAAYGYLAAARACEGIRQHAEAARWAKQAAYLMLGFNDDSFFDHYHSLISRGGLPTASIVYGASVAAQLDDNWIKMAEEDVKYMTEKKLAAPLLARAHYRVARAKYRTNDIAGAAAELKTALELDKTGGGAARHVPLFRPVIGLPIKTYSEPSLRDVIKDLAAMLEKLGQSAGGMALLEQAHAEHPADRELLKDLALQYTRAEQKDKAIAAWKQFLELERDSEFALNQMAKLEGRAVPYTDTHGFNREGAPEVQAKYKKLIALNATVGRLKTEKKYDEALQAVRALLKEYPTADEPMLHEIHLLIKLGKYDEALARVDEYQKISSDYSRAMTADNLRKTIKDIKIAKEQNKPAPNEDF